MLPANCSPRHAAFMTCAGDLFMKQLRSRFTSRARTSWTSLGKGARHRGHSCLLCRAEAMHWRQPLCPADRGSFLTARGVLQWSSKIASGYVQQQDPPWVRTPAREHGQVGRQACHPCGRQEAVRGQVPQTRDRGLTTRQGDGPSILAQHLAADAAQRQSIASHADQLLELILHPGSGRLHAFLFWMLRSGLLLYGPAVARDPSSAQTAGVAPLCPPGPCTGSGGQVPGPSTFTELGKKARGSKRDNHKVRSACPGHLTSIVRPARADACVLLLPFPTPRSAASAMTGIPGTSAAGSSHARQEHHRQHETDLLQLGTGAEPASVQRKPCW